jgi:hypothetical protein
MAAHGKACLLLITVMLAALVRPASAEERVDTVCWDGDNGRPECETFAAFEATCAAVGNQNQVCQNVLVSKAPSSASSTYFPASTKYTSVRLTRAQRTAWQKAKTSLGY